MNKTTTLKEFVDFAFSLKEMEEVKKIGFPIPKEVVFSLSKLNHNLLQREIFREKKITPTDSDFSDVFELEIYDINFKFIIE